MELIVTIIVLGFCLLVVGAILGFVANAKVGRLEKEVQSLRQLLLSRDAPVFEPRPATVAKAANLTQTKIAESDPDSKAKTAPKPEPKPEFKRQFKEPPAPVAKTKMPTTPEATKPKPSLEELIGAKWSVWVGGIALVFGAIFLLRYTIEAGVFTPAMRIAMAALLGVALLGVGEFLRRADDRLGKDTALAKSLRDNAYIPGVLTAVGIFALLGTVYAAFELYGFISAPMAFILMGSVSLGALALGLLHGPKLAALGLVASLATPLLIQTTEPNALALYGYLTVVSLAALALAHKRRWGWLNIATLAGAMFWIFFSLRATKAIDTHMMWLAFTGLMFAISTYLGTQKHDEEQLSKKTQPLEYTANVAWFWGVFAAIAMLSATFMNDYARRHYGLNLGFAAVLIGVAIIRPRQSWHILTAGALGALLVAGAEYAQGYGHTEILVTISVMSLIFIAACVSRLKINFPAFDAPQKQGIWAAVAALFPITQLLWLTEQTPPYSTDTLSLLFLAITLVFAGLTFWVWRQMRGQDIAPSIFALGTAIAYICAAYLGLGGKGETAALILGIALAGIASRYLPLLITRIIAAGFGLLTAAHVLFLQIPKAGAVSETVIFNELWLYFALPAFICGGVSSLLSRRENDLWSEGLKALAVSFAALFVVFQIRHFMNGGEILSSELDFDELALQVLTGLCFTFGSSLMNSHGLNFKGPRHEQLLPMLAIGISLLTFATFVFGVCLARAPIFNAAETVSGGGVFNSLLLAYLLPALLLAAIAWFTRHKHPSYYIKAAAALSLISAMLYITSMIRFGFHGEAISIFDVRHTDAELYTISAAWLLAGIALLVVGMKGKRQDIRMASAIIIVMTVLKAFLIDMASLEGVLRAMSFVVLGVVLIVIGRAYQRLLFAKDS